LLIVESVRVTKIPLQSKALATKLPEHGAAFKENVEKSKVVV
jgi:hypothetical protein